MRLQSLLALVVSGALLLPMAAQAATSVGENSEFMKSCVQQATAQGTDAAKAKSHCSCTANGLEKNFTKAELEALDSKNGVDAKLKTRADGVFAACAKQNQ
ncbi:hypothetical protein IAE33_000772 [Pseudomonas sp. S60]|uniref:hypothetical protein n=1 Tax=Pseudomonas sp. S60 TaxID=211124 RepID=UPI0019131511|nr:hypothetical protein [Pseudomonas sp. S60]MBK5008912.1 hypothetical protein [Pseudomonas sp. S60]